MTTTLEAITTNFRRFTKNQVLTEGHLNQIVDYFDDQIRLSRTCLSGVGIVCGFEVSCDDTTQEITITQGVGVTTDGNLFHLYKEDSEGNFSIDLESLTYAGYRSYDNTDAQYTPFFYRNNAQLTLRELTLESSGDGIRPLSNLSTLKDMVVLLYLETYIEDADLCTTLGCDNQGENKVANYRALIVSKTDASYIMSHDDTIQKTNYGKLYYDLPEIVVHKVVSAPAIFDTYDDLRQSFVDAISADNTIQKLRDGYDILFTTLNANDLSTDIDAKILELLDFDITDVPNDFQYRYDLLKDLVATYNEIKELLLNIDVSDCCAGYKDFPKHLMLGEIEKETYCHEYRHGFYKSPILADHVTNTCDSCDPMELEYDIETGDDAGGCVGNEGTADNHIVFVIDESGSFNAQITYVKDSLNGYLSSIADTDTHISLIGMSTNIDNTRTDHVIHRHVTDPDLVNWIDNVYGTSASQGNGGADYWASGYQVVIESILDTEIPDPTIVIVLGDEGPGPYSQSHSMTIERAGIIKRESKLFNYIVDTDSSSDLSIYAPDALSSDSVPSIDGETDIDTSDYFLAVDFRDLEIKITNLNESLISSNILCPETTEDEVVIDPDNSVLTICYRSGKSEQRFFTLLKRAAQQITNYNAEYSFIKITPTLDLGNLSKKAIPFYYNVGEKLIEYWDFDKTILGRQKTNLSYHDSLLVIKKPLAFCVDSNFYRVEGHVGRNYVEVVGRINTIKKESSLGFNVVALPIETTDTLGEDYKSYYLNRNYGLEHKAGVPPGGTLVLFYLEGTVEDVNNPVVADFCLPYLCCDENEIAVGLPDEVICFDETTEPVPFEVVPATAVVRADVPDGLNGGVIRNDDGTYSFDARLVSEELHGVSIRFIVNNQNANFGVRVYEKPQLEVNRTISYNYNSTIATVTFIVTGSELETISEYTWDFGDGSPLSNVEPNLSGQVVYSYSLPVAGGSTIYPRLTISRDFCTSEVPIEAIEFDEVPYYYYYYGYSASDSGAAISGDAILSMSIGDLS